MLFINNNNIKNKLQKYNKNVIRKDYILLVIDECEQFDQYLSSNDQITKISSYIYSQYDISIKNNIILNYIDYFEQLPNIAIFNLYNNIMTNTNKIINDNNEEKEEKEEKEIAILVS